MTLSTVHQLHRVSFPAFTGERIYMREFTQAAGLPNKLKHWQDTVDHMLDGIEVDGPIYLMVDQGRVKAHGTHRRGGVHIDGYWHPELQAHDGTGGRHGSHSRDINESPYFPPSRHGFGDGYNDGHWFKPRHAFQGSADEAIIIATDVLGCRAFVGQYEGDAADGGDCSHIDVESMEQVNLEPGIAWGGHTRYMLHESIPVAVDCLRTVVRLNVPGLKLDIM